MQPHLTIHSEYPDIPQHLPCISIIIPFDSRMNTQSGLATILSAAADKHEKKAFENYAGSDATILILKLRSVIKNLNYKRNNQSIAIFVSTLAAKVYYFKYSDNEIYNSRS